MPMHPCRQPHFANLLSGTPDRQCVHGAGPRPLLASAVAVLHLLAADVDRVRQATGRRSGSGFGIPIARGSLPSFPVDRDHHRHIVHAPGGQLSRDSHPGRHIVPFVRSFLLFGSGYGGLRQFSDGDYPCPSRCRSKLCAIRNGIPVPDVRILGGEVFGVNPHPYHGRRND